MHPPRCCRPSAGNIVKDFAHALYGKPDGQTTDLSGLPAFCLKSYGIKLSVPSQFSRDNYKHKWQAYISGAVHCSVCICQYDVRLTVCVQKIPVFWFAWLQPVMKSEGACMRKVELWVAVLRGRQVAGRPHYRRLSMYELIDFNGFLNVQVAGFHRSHRNV